MTVQPPGRRTESLFDNRYRYDHIYPRGRSGETLRAYDTHDQDRPVVIKRPASQDAPPMRAGQEVSIRTEKQALERLTGHPVLTELRGSGTFRVGGHTHEYIVMDMAVGEIVETLVLERAAQGEYLPELEVLVIIDNLLDLLAHAHDRQVIYNDVDAKHLFWDRANYRLKVIDWGNAVFTDEPGAPPAISRATDIYQVGELLYFIFTGGNRLAVEVQDGDNFFVNFGPTADRLSARLQGIITRAVHSDPRRRYGTIRELRHALAEYRQPLEKTRDDLLARVRKRVRPTASQEELEELRASLQGALDMDPGYPEVAALAADIQRILRQISLQADLDAIRIYLESGNWTRALALLHDLLPDTDDTNQPLVRFLIAASATLEDLRVAPPPNSFLNALTPLFQGDAPGAGQVLLTASEARPNSRQAQWLLAEQLAIYLPDVVLLRPHFVRLRETLPTLPNARATLALLDQIEAELGAAPAPGLVGLQVIYQQIGDLLNQLETTLSTALDSEADQKAALAPLRRAGRAAQEVIARLDTVGQHVYGDPDRARNLLQQAAMIDPTSPYFATMHEYFEEVRQAITALAQFKPRSDGSNLSAWFADVQNFIRPYLDDLSDPQFHAAAGALQQAAEGWTTVLNYLALGRRQPTIKLLRDTAEVIRSFNEQVAAWLGALANRVPDAPFVEQISPNQALTAKLIDGWKAWDRGDTVYAAESGQQAYDLARTDGERMAANRLKKLGELLDHWLADHGPEDLARTDQTEAQVMTVLLSDEEHERQTFAEQMPNTTLYLRTMSRGIVAFMQQSSSAGWRALYLHYVLRGMLALLENELDDADFWCNAAAKSFENARTHRAFQVLDRALTGRRLVQNAQQALNAVAGPKDLEAARGALNAPLAGELLAGAQQSVQLANDAVRSWSDGDFYAARQALDSALDHMQRAVETTPLRAERYITWLTGLRDAAVELQQARLTVEQGAVSTSEEPDPAVAAAHGRIVIITRDTLGADYAHQVRQWEDMYRAVLDTYTTPRMTRGEKLAAFERHFASLFITRHPAYPLFRHWQSIISQLPPDEVEDQLLEAAPPPPLAPVDSPTYLEDDRESGRASRRAAEAAPSSDLPWNWIIAGVVVVLIGAVGLAVVRNLSSGKKDNPRTPVPTAILATAPVLPQASATSAVVAAQPTTTPPPILVQPTSTAVPTTPAATLAPSATPTVLPTDAPPTITPTLFLTSTLLPSRTPVSVAALPASGSGNDVLAALAALPANIVPGPAGALVPATNGAWVLSAGDSGNTPRIIEIPPDLLSAMFQPGAANSLRRVDITLELAGYDPLALGDGAVAFGLGAANADDQQAIGEVQFIETNFVSLGLNEDGRFRSSTQFPQPNPQLTLSVRRTNETTLSFYVNDKWLGDSVYLFPQNEPVTLLLFVAGEGVTVKIDSFTIDYSPRDEIP